ncbi:MAG: iron ABC transporter permease [Gammaproteobacteria bacterium]|nr:iron ABC transporter permease [Gammaproteobacteria bacterium]
MASLSFFQHYHHHIQRLQYSLRRSSWSLSAVFLALLISLPVLTLLSYLLQPNAQVWQHLASTVLPKYIYNSLWLMFGVGSLSLIIGISTAWLVSMCRFPGRNYLQWALLLPMAIPGYIIAFTYAGLLDPAGIVQTQLRDTFAWQYGDYWFPEIRSLWGAIVMLSLVLYPYVYLTARAAFLEQSICVLEVSRTLGCTAWRAFFRIALPLARPAIVAGLLLALMETLADFGTVDYFGVPTFTTGIFRTWFGLGDAAAAAQLACVLMSFIFILIVVERISRQGARYHHTSSRYSELPAYHLKGVWKLTAISICLLPVLLGFIIPATQLLRWSWQTFSNDAEFHTLIFNSLWLASITALLALLLAAALAYGQRLHPSLMVRASLRFAGTGYAMPGTVIAVGVMILAGAFDARLDTFWQQLFNEYSPILLSGTFVALIFAYLVRFLSVSLSTVEAGLGKIKPSMDDAARALGRRALPTLLNIHFPLMRGTLLTALLMVFVDVMKELPATLVMRPFNFNTLAVRAYELASEEQLAAAAPAGLAIVVAGIIPVILISYSIQRARPGTHANNITP